MVRVAVRVPVDVLDYKREGGQASTSARYFQSNLGYHADEPDGLHPQGHRTGQHQEGIQGKWVSFLYVGSINLLYCLWPNECRMSTELHRRTNPISKNAILNHSLHSGPVMFVANHCSWMDIPFVGVNVGWRNYKMIAKQELLKVPILSKSLSVAGHVMLDRSSRRSQFNAYKKGVQYLKDGVNLVTFPEGTRSRDGRLGPFKKGAFKMAEAVNAPIVPMTIGYAHKVQPLDFIFPVRRSRSIPATIHFGEAIDTAGKKDEEVMEAVWNEIAADLPESQKPLEGTPKAVN